MSNEEFDFNPNHFVPHIYVSDPCLLAAEQYLSTVRRQASYICDCQLTESDTGSIGDLSLPPARSGDGTVLRPVTTYCRHIVQ